MPSVEHGDGSTTGADGHKRNGSTTGSDDSVSVRHGGEGSRKSGDFLSSTDNSQENASSNDKFVAPSGGKTGLASSSNDEAQSIRFGDNSSNGSIFLDEEDEETREAVVAAASIQPNFRLSERASAFSIAALLQTKQRHSSTRTAAEDDASAPPRAKKIRLRNSTENDRDSGIEIDRHRMKLKDSGSDVVAIDTGMVSASAAGTALTHPDSPLHLLSDGCRNGRSSAICTNVVNAADGAEVKKGGCGLVRDETEGVVCQLESKELWNRFHELGTEMIITKSGRRMFPVLSVSFSGLVPDESYLVATDMVPVDNKRYRYTYHRSAWLVAGRADPQPTTSGLHVHPDCPMSGRQLNRHPISFERIKLTNSTGSTNTPNDKSGHVVLASMHKYRPRIHLIRRSAALASSVAEERASSTGQLEQLQLQNLKQEHYRTFIFPETEFIAVTAYQNQMITKLKIDSNPFAKGFRDSTRLTDMEREGYPCAAGDLEGFKDLLPAPLPHPSSLYPGPHSTSSYNHLPIQKILQDASSKICPGHSTISSVFNHVYHSSLSSSSSIVETSFDYPPSMIPTSGSKLSVMTSLRHSPTLHERKSPSWTSAHDQQSRDRNRVDSRLLVSDEETIQQTEVYRMISLLPRPSINEFSPATDLALSPAAMAAANSFYALRYHPYLAACTVLKLHSNGLQS